MKQKDRERNGGYTQTFVLVASIALSHHGLSHGN